LCGDLGGSEEKKNKITSAIINDKVVYQFCRCILAIHKMQCISHPNYTWMHNYLTKSHVSFSKID